jgi:hypothetical protein
MSLRNEGDYVAWPLEDTLTPLAMHHVRLAVLAYLDSGHLGRVDSRANAELCNLANLIDSHLERRKLAGMAKARPAPIIDPLLE